MGSKLNFTAWVIWVAHIPAPTSSCREAQPAGVHLRTLAKSGTQIVIVIITRSCVASQLSACQRRHSFERKLLHPISSRGDINVTPRIGGDLVAPSQHPLTLDAADGEQQSFTSATARKSPSSTARRSRSLVRRLFRCQPPNDAWLISPIPRTRKHTPAGAISSQFWPARLLNPLTLAAHIR
jgi:hypothetical protein